MNPQISKTQVNTCTSNHKGECYTKCTLQMCYGLIHPHRRGIVNPSISSKPRLHERFILDMMKYAFMPPRYKARGEGQGDTWSKNGKNRQTNLIGNT